MNIESARATLAKASEMDRELGASIAALGESHAALRTELIGRKASLGRVADSLRNHIEGKTA
jgi:hypothetical protein